MKVAIISAYHKEPLDTIKRCVDSVKAQTHTDCTHILVSDGHPLDDDVIVDWGVQHVRLPKEHADFGDTPRLVGSAMAYSQGFDALCWLDADNWIEPNHVALLVQHATIFGADVVTATRTLYWPDGRKLDLCLESDGKKFNDTNCYLVMRRAMFVAGAWVFKDTNLSVVGDRVVWKEMQRFARAHCSTPTVNYTSNVAVHYTERGLEPPPEARIIIQEAGEPYPKSLLYSSFKDRK